MAVNHVPDATVAAVDDLGEGVLYGDPRPVDCRLRSDLRLRIPCDGAAIERGRTAVVFGIRPRGEGREEPARIRDRGSFVATVVDGVNGRLRAWGLRPPDAYRIDWSPDSGDLPGGDREDSSGGPEDLPRGDREEWVVYAGPLALP